MGVALSIEYIGLGWLGECMGRKSLAQLVLEDGPPCICVLVGDPKGRWRSQAMANSVEGKPFRSARAELVAGSIGDDLPIIAGIVVVEEWRFVHRRPHHVQSEFLMEAARTYFPRRRGMVFLEHTLLACARWKGAADFPDNWQALPLFAFWASTPWTPTRWMLGLGVLSY